MCQVCEFKRDVRLLNLGTSTLGQVDYERLDHMTDLLARIVTTAEQSDGSFGFLSVLPTANEDLPLVKSLRTLTKLAEEAQQLVEAFRTSRAVTEGLIREAIGMIATEEEAHTTPPSAFAEFFGGGDDEV